MIKPKIPENEAARLDALFSYQIMDTAEEEVYDQLTQLASYVCGTKISLISLIDQTRQWFKSHHGLDARETPRELAFCAHAIYEKKCLIVNDSRKDERFHDNPLVTGNPNVIFYAGVPLVDEAGYALGTLCVIDNTPKALTEEQIQLLNGIAQQIVAQFRLRRELSDKQLYVNQITQLSAQVPGVIYQYQMFSDGTSCFPFTSRAIMDIYEVTPEQVRNDASLVFTRLHPEDLNEIVDSIKKSAANLENWSLDYRVNLPTKGMRWLRGFAKPERMSNGSTLWHGFITDVTEVKKLEMQLHQTSKMVALGEMASGVAHEINNPLAIIIAKSQQTLREIDKPLPKMEKIRSDIEKIENTANRITKIVKGLRAFSRNAEHDPHINTNLKTIIDDTVALVKEKFLYHTIKLDIQCPEEVSINCNPTQIEQVLMNLLSNGFDAVKTNAEKWIRIVVSIHSSTLKILVTDSGKGIPQAVASKIMQPFYSTKSVGEGTGLGLSVSKGLIESHGGSLQYDQTFINTTFKIELPYRKEIEKPKAA